MSANGISVNAILVWCTAGAPLGILAFFGMARAARDDRWASALTMRPEPTRRHVRDVQRILTAVSEGLISRLLLTAAAWVGWPLTLWWALKARRYLRAHPVPR